MRPKHASGRAAELRVHACFACVQHASGVPSPQVGDAHPATCPAAHCALVYSYRGGCSSVVDSHRGGAPHLLRWTLVGRPGYSTGEMGNGSGRVRVSLCGACTHPEQLVQLARARAQAGKLTRGRTSARPAASGVVGRGAHGAVRWAGGRAGGFLYIARTTRLKGSRTRT